MASVDAQNVAKEVLETVGKGKKVVLGKIIKKNGYAQNTADSPKQVTNTKSFQNVINPIVQRWEKERERITLALENKDLDKEQYRTLVNALDTITKNVQLLTGGKTENNGMGELAETLNTWINSKK